MLDVLGKSEEKEHKSDWGSMLLAAEGDERKQVIEMMKSGRKATKQSINMAYLLQKLDGIESAEDRIIIATTNNPDKINPALLRPGRFDLKLCLGNCTQDMYCQILENFYRESEKNVSKRVLKAAIPDYKYSPLELMNMAMQCESLSALLEKCCSADSKHN
jgi:SpoVK/Ycf46/Vps4 family AAA+-type ATPase